MEAAKGRQAAAKATTGKQHCMRSDGPKELVGRHGREALEMLLLDGRVTRGYSGAIGRQRRDLEERERGRERGWLRGFEARELWKPRGGWLAGRLEVTWDLGLGEFGVIVLGDVLLRHVGCWKLLNRRKDDGRVRETVALQVTKGYLEPSSLVARDYKKTKSRVVRTRLKQKWRDISLLNRREVRVAEADDAASASAGNEMAKAKGLATKQMALKMKREQGNIYGSGPATAKTLANCELHDVSETIEVAEADKNGTELEDKVDAENEKSGEKETSRFENANGWRDLSSDEDYSGHATFQARYSPGSIKHALFQGITHLQHKDKPPTRSSETGDENRSKPESDRYSFVLSSEQKRQERIIALERERLEKCGRAVDIWNHAVGDVEGDRRILSSLAYAEQVSWLRVPVSVD